ncbi:MAG: hypothetical protein WC479_00625 [Candidatus Izemoplasmatales bacterium]
MKFTLRLKGGLGSGHYGHKGRPGHQGGSLPEGSSASAVDKWFSGSKVVDTKGNPITVYHGTPNSLVYNTNYSKELHNAIVRIYKDTGRINPPSIDDINKDLDGWGRAYRDYQIKNGGDIIKQTSPFTEFDLDKSGSNTESNDAKGGIYFTPSKDFASYFVSTRTYDPLLEKTYTKTGVGAKIYSAILSVKNPLDLRYGSSEDSKARQRAAMTKIENLKRQGYDGIVNYVKDSSGRRQTEWVVFDPKQIKIVDEKSN